MLQNNKIRVARYKPFDEKKTYSLYAIFDKHGKFLFFEYADYIVCFLEDLFKTGYVYDADLDHLKKLEKMY